ncbi:hypothetical protein [Streptomyces griseicoloratus]|uniref:hypothetical protein n=1 Tax=Streptomyces griseicoloratus TaxID=2752516 RepID=UPI002810F617|nr:hypothetical protein [Streptomyces griseicoloratus]
MIVHSDAGRRPAAEQWLLSAHASPGQARREWQEQGVTLLPLGTLFSAVRIPGRLVHAVAATADPREVDAFLEEALEGGPVICDPYGPRYYALVHGSMPTTWRAAAEDWRVHDVACLGHGTYLGVPRLDIADCPEHATASYWSVPMPSAATLCPPLSVARLISAGAHRMAEDAEMSSPAEGHPDPVPEP